MSSEKQFPVAKLSVGSIHAAVWRKESPGKSPFYSTTFELRYQDKDGAWKSGESYGQTDLLALAKCADLAFSEIVLLRRRDSEAAKAA
jgi:hypothetical protein